MTKLRHNPRADESTEIEPADFAARPDAFASLYAGWLEARSKLVLLNATALAHPNRKGADFDERAIKLCDLQDDFARRLGAMPMENVRQLLAKLDVAANCAVADAAYGENPTLILIAGIRADLFALQAKQ